MRRNKYYLNCEYLKARQCLLLSAYGPNVRYVDPVFCQEKCGPSSRSVGRPGKCGSIPAGRRGSGYDLQPGARRAGQPVDQGTGRPLADDLHGQDRPGQDVPAGGLQPQRGQATGVGGFMVPARWKINKFFAEHDDPTFNTPQYLEYAKLGGGQSIASKPW